MKKLIFGLIMAFACSFCFTASHAQSTTTAQTTSQVAKKAKKTKTHAVKAADKTKAAATTSSEKTVKKASKAAKTEKKSAAKEAKKATKSEAKTASAKVDATGHHLKKDGTKDMRYKENKK